MKNTTLIRNIQFCVILAAFFSWQSLANPSTVWIDVRSSFEYKFDHIDGDIRISHGDIIEEVSKRFSDKDTEIHLYCRSGGRANKALQALKSAGYTNVTNEGGIDDVRKKRKIQDNDSH